jgi:hypothetical protein
VADAKNRYFYRLMTPMFLGRGKGILSASACKPVLLGMGGLQGSAFAALGCMRILKGIPFSLMHKLAWMVTSEGIGGLRWCMEA